MQVRLAFVVLLLNASSVSADEDELRRILRARRDAISNIQVTYSSKTTYAPALAPNDRALLVPVLAPNRPSIMAVKTGIEIKKCSFRYDQGKALYSFKHEDTNEDRIYAFTAGRSEMFVRRNDRKRGAITPPGPLPRAAIIDRALGLRSFGAKTWIDDDLLRNADLSITDLGDVKVSWSDAFSKHVWLCNRRAGYSIERYERSRHGTTYMVIQNGDFRQVEKTFLPFKINYRHLTFINGVESVHKEVEITASNYDLDRSDGEAEHFSIKWPTGTRVIHTDSGVQMKVTSKARTIDDATIEEVTKTR